MRQPGTEQHLEFFEQLRQHMPQAVIEGVQAIYLPERHALAEALLVHVSVQAEPVSVYQAIVVYPG